MCACVGGVCACVVGRWGGEGGGNKMGTCVCVQITTLRQVTEVLSSPKIKLLCA